MCGASVSRRAASMPGSGGHVAGTASIGKLAGKVRASFIASDRTYGARRVWHDMLAMALNCGLDRVERLMRAAALRARPRWRRLPSDATERLAGSVAANVLDREFAAPAPNRKWIVDFTYV